MKKNFLLMLSVAAIMLSSCGTTGTVPITGRKQHLLVSNDQVLSSSLTQYNSYMKSAKESTNAANCAMVTRVGQRIANAVETYLKANGYAEEVKDFAWEFHLVQDKNANAFCMPGGKIVVYEGLLPYTQNEASLAIVLGHEVAHAVAKHSAERMSKQYEAQYGAQALSMILGGASSSTQAIAQQVYGLGANYGVMLPYSRKYETEADNMGLIFAAMAGYDPNVAVSFWQRMSQAGNNTPEFFSDHPSDASRIANIQKLLPTALKYYKPAGVSTTTKTVKFKKSSRKR